MTDQIISRVIGNLGHITLNRPKALNALTLDMVREVTRLMVAWEADDNIGAVIVDGAGERAFCAGGDVILLHDSGKAGDSRAEQFWREEYILNEYISRYAKPYICLIDGFVMGGGVGLSVHGRLRIAGDNTLFAMPETGIGYFPDVGGTYFLPRLPDHAGNWLGLTGARIDKDMACALGVANAYVPSNQHGDVIEALGHASLDGSDAAVVNVLMRYVRPTQNVDMPAGLSCFGEATVPAILRALDAQSDEWSAKQAGSIRKKSPLAIVTTFEALRKGRDLTFRAAMDQELNISLGFLETQDFYEGIRAQLIDKDRNPKWSHDSVDSVSEIQSARVFRKRAERLNYIA